MGLEWEEWVVGKTWRKVHDEERKKGKKEGRKEREYGKRQVKKEGIKRRSKVVWKKNGK